ncbi:MAG: hypothetical protein KY434_00590 [Actinobacteria bacterium]|nr:hypothetical protein [Actinomycetota bacterium]
MATTGTTRARWAAAAVAIAPAVMLAGLLSHPYIAVLPDAAAVAAAAASDTTRWGLAHLTVAVGSGLTALAFLAIRGFLREAGEERWSAPGVPFIVLGSTLFAVLPGLEFAPLAAAETGGDVEATQAVLEPWFLPILGTGVLTFAVGALCFALGIARSRVMGRGLTGLVVGALAVMAVSRGVPAGAVQFYLQGAAGVAALWPLAYRMWGHPQSRPVRHPQPMPAT